MGREITVEKLELYAKLQETWEEGFDFAIDYYDGIIDALHRAAHPNESFSYKKCYQAPCKDIY